MIEIEKEFTCIVPDYLKFFKCDWQYCGAACCKGFQVDIDRQTHQKYKSISDQNLRRKILDSLEWNKSTKTYRMRLENAICPMLRDDLLCTIQKNFGEEFLSDTCADFPRRTYVVDKVIERSLSLTCPIAARLALMRKSPMKFEKMTFKTTHAASFFYRSVNEVPTRKYLVILQQIAFEVLQDRRMTLNERLTALGIIFSEIDGLIINGKGEHLNLIFGIYRSEDYFKNLTAKVRSLKFQRENYLSIMFELAEKIFSKAVVYFSTEQRNFTKYVAEAFEFIDETNKPLPELFRLYDNNIKIYKKIALDPFNHVLENYLVHSFFGGIFPCHMSGSLMRNYLLFLTLFKFFEFGLISMTAVMKEKFSIDDLLEFVERFSKRVDHATKFQQIILDYIINFEEYPLEVMTSLIDFAI